MSSYLSFKFTGRFVKILLREFAGFYSRSFHGCRHATPVLQYCSVPFRPNDMWRKAGQVKDTPKSIARA
jgi:hypothetical protein